MIDKEFLTCKKIKLKDETVLLGIIIRENPNTIVFQTKKRKYLLSRDRIKSIEETCEIFEGGENNGRN